MKFNSKCHLEHSSLHVFSVSMMFLFCWVRSSALWSADRLGHYCGLQVIITLCFGPLDWSCCMYLPQPRPELLLPATSTACSCWCGCEPASPRLQVVSLHVPTTPLHGFSSHVWQDDFRHLFIHVLFRILAQFVLSPAQNSLLHLFLGSMWSLLRMHV